MFHLFPFKKGFILPAGFLFLLVSCNGPSRKPAPESGEVKKAKVAVPVFNADSAYSFVSRQVAFGPRVPNTEAHRKCAAFLVSTLKGYAKEVIVQQGQLVAFNGDLLNFQNIIATFRPETQNRILLCAHWDSRPWADHDPDPKNHRKPIDGANDGASGTGVLLEVARQLSLNPPPTGIDIILFDAEDYGPPQDRQTGEDTGAWWGLGSQYWAKQPHKTGYYAKFGILLDMVGAKGATFLLEGISMNYAAPVARNVWSVAGRIGYSDYFFPESGTYVTDDHYYINRILNIPTIDIIHLDRTSETGFYKTWHTVKDNMESIDRNTLKAVGQTVLTVIYED
jgi:hypothetical protein